MRRFQVYDTRQSRRTPPVLIVSARHAFRWVSFTLWYSETHVQRHSIYSSGKSKNSPSSVSGKHLLCKPFHAVPWISSKASSKACAFAKKPKNTSNGKMQRHRVPTSRTYKISSQYRLLNTQVILHDLQPVKTQSKLVGNTMEESLQALFKALRVSAAGGGIVRRFVCLLVGFLQHQSIGIEWFHGCTPASLNQQLLCKGRH